MSQPAAEMMPPPSPRTVDRISALPDELLRHIFSFLPTKLAFASSILSKQWTSLCHSLTTFYFDDEGVQDKQAYLRFESFVNKVLLSPLVQHQPIKTFCLLSRPKLYDYRHKCNVGEWLEAAKRRSVENLELSTSTWLLSLSPGVFTSRTLVVLKLNGFYMRNHDFESVDLPSLR